MSDDTLTRESEHALVSTTECREKVKDTLEVKDNE